MNKKLRLLVVLLCAAVVSACGHIRARLPKESTITIHKFKDLPSWATEIVQIPQPADGTVASHLQSENDRGVMLEYVNCRALLTQKMDRGEKVDKNDCDKP